MCDTAMHMEALRKTRVLERKQDAQKRLVDQQGQDFAMLEEQGSMDAQRAAAQQKERFQQYQTLHAQQTRVNTKQGVAYDRMQYDHSRNGPTVPITWKDMQRQLKYEEKVLRDHNLYMGPMTAFKELYDRGLLEPKQ